MCAAFDVSSGLLIPVLNVRDRTGCRALRMDQQLIGEIVVVGDGRCTQKGLPAFGGRGDVTQLPDGNASDVLIVCHSVFSSLLSRCCAGGSFLFLFNGLLRRETVCDVHESKGVHIQRLTIAPPIQHNHITHG